MSILLKVKLINLQRDTSSETSENYDEVIEKLNDENKTILMKVRLNYIEEGIIFKVCL